MKNKKSVVNFGVFILFFTILFFATDIVLLIPLKEMYHLRKIDATQYADLSREFTAHVESFSANQDIMFTVEFSGYAFIKTEQESNNKVIKLVFASDENRYEVDTEVLDRVLLRDLFREKEIIGINHGFITRFSPISMENGVYNLYIYCYENENVVGLFDTYRIFEKDYRSFVEITDNPK